MLVGSVSGTVHEVRHIVGHDEVSTWSIAGGRVGRPPPIEPGTRAAGRTLGYVHLHYPQEEVFLT